MILDFENYLKVGDWCFFEFKFGQIKSVKESRVTEFTDGFISTAGWKLNDRIFPLNMRIKVISDKFDYIYRKINQLTAKQRLNYTDIYGKLVDIWVDECKATNDFDKEIAQRRLLDLEKAVDNKDSKFENISIFRN